MQSDQGYSSESAQEGIQTQTLLNQTREAERGIREETGKRGMGFKGTWDGDKRANVSSGERKESAQPCTLLRLSWGNAEGFYVKRPM